MENEPTTAELEKAVQDNPQDAQALVRLANNYWLEGRGPELVNDLANRARALDPSNRGAWHLWALAESDVRRRVDRWKQVTVKFPNDDLALATLADNAASLAGAEHDYDALDIAIATYERLLVTARTEAQRNSLTTAIATLRKWKF